MEKIEVRIVMSNKYSGKNKKTYAKKGMNPLMIPLFIIVSIIPLIVRAYLYETYLAGYDYFSSEEESIDFFLGWKMWLFVGISAVLLLLLMYKLVTSGKKIKTAKLFIPLLAYALLAILSTIFSDYNYFSMMGITEQFESLFVLLGYALSAYYTFLVINEEKDINTLIAFLAVGAVIMLYIGITQAFGTDFFKTDLARVLMLPKELQSLGEFRFAFEEGRVYLTLYNPNYVGSYAALMFPVFLMATISFKKVWQKVLFGILAAGVVFELVFSLSKAGFIGLFVGIVVMAIASLRDLKAKVGKYFIPVLAGAFALVVAFFVIDSLSERSVVKRVISGTDVEETVRPLESIETNDDLVVIHYNGHTLSLRSSFDAPTGIFDMSAFDDDGKLVEYHFNEETYYEYTDDERYKNIEVALCSINENVTGMAVKIDGVDWNFTNLVNDGTYHYYTPYGKFVKLTGPSESVEWLENHGRLFTGRGFIWAKTIPLLKDYIFLGSGPDTYQIVFPNTDYVALSNGGYLGQIMTKPHNMYLQTAVQTGVLSLICILAFYIMYAVLSIKAIAKKKFSTLKLYAVGLFAGSMGYMVTGIINDSTIAVAPMFWVLVGAGVATDYLLIEASKKENEVING